MFDPDPQRLEYASPELNRNPLPGFRRAILLSVPGTCAWACYFAICFQSRIPGFLPLFAAVLLIPMLPVAIVSALISLPVFIRLRRNAYPWYVCWCLLINISGLSYFLWTATPKQ